MRIVPNLKEVYECPSCGRKDYFLHNHTNDMGREYLFCACCHEEIYESEMTCDEGAEKKKKKDDFIFEMREEISNLTWSIHDSKTQALVENIQNILNRIIDYIEEN